MKPLAPVQVSGFDEQDAVPVDVPRFVQLAQLVLREERADPDAELGLIFVDEDAITDLNERFLDSDGPTDVLAFPQDEAFESSYADSADADPTTLLGDVVLCPEAVSYTHLTLPTKA